MIIADYFLLFICVFTVVMMAINYEYKSELTYATYRMNMVLLALNLGCTLVVYIGISYVYVDRIIQCPEFTPIVW